MNNTLKTSLVVLTLLTGCGGGGNPTINLPTQTTQEDNKQEIVRTVFNKLNISDDKVDAEYTKALADEKIYDSIMNDSNNESSIVRSANTRRRSSSNNNTNTSLEDKKWKIVEVKTKYTNLLKQPAEILNQFQEKLGDRLKDTMKESLTLIKTDTNKKSIEELETVIKEAENIVESFVEKMEEVKETVLKAIDNLKKDTTPKTENKTEDKTEGTEDKTEEDITSSLVSSLPDISNLQSITIDEATPLNKATKIIGYDNHIFNIENGKIVIDYEENEFFSNFRKGKDGLTYAEQEDENPLKSFKCAILEKEGNEYKVVGVGDNVDEAISDVYSLPELDKTKLNEDQTIENHGTFKIIDTGVSLAYKQIMKLGGAREGLSYSDFGIITETGVYGEGLDYTATELSYRIVAGDEDKRKTLEKQTTFSGSIIGGINNNNKETILELDGKLNLTISSDNTSNLNATFDNWYTFNVTDMNTVTLSDEDKVADEWKYKDLNNISIKDKEIQFYGDKDVEEVVGSIKFEQQESYLGDRLSTKLVFGGKVAE